VTQQLNQLPTSPRRLNKESREDLKRKFSWMDNDKTWKIGDHYLEDVIYDLGLEEKFEWYVRTVYQLEYKQKQYSILVWHIHLLLIWMTFLTSLISQSMNLKQIAKKDFAPLPVCSQELRDAFEEVKQKVILLL
jgi:hypothetical protein